MKGSLWNWIGQRVSAVLLLLLVAGHFSIMHFVDPTIEFTFASSSLRFQRMAYFVVNTLLLTLALYHGLNGIRNIVLDYWPKAARNATWALTLIGLLFAGYGSAALFVFLNGN